VLEGIVVSVEAFGDSVATGCEGTVAAGESESKSDVVTNTISDHSCHFTYSSSCCKDS